MTEKYVIKSLSKLDTGSDKQVFNIFVEIRTKVVKSKNGVSLLIKHGIVPKLLSNLTRNDNDKENGKLTDLVLSILGNLCMEENARRQVMAHDGISDIVGVFCENDSASIQNRSCRTLANLCLSPDCCLTLHKTDMIPRIVELLQTSPSKENRLTYCRALRLLGKSPSNLEKLVSHDAVRQVAWLLKEEETKLRNASLRTIYEFSSVRCTTGFASQVNNAGVIPNLVEWMSDTNTEVSHQSTTLLIKLLEHSHIRSSFGGAGGILLLMRIMEEDKVIEKLNRFSALNILCLCCKEVVNRVKIRENGGLIMLLSFLEDKHYRCLHDRIISALQCYLYDDESFDILLKNGVVSILTKHLQRVAKFETSVPTLCYVKIEHISADENVESSGSTGEFCKKLTNIETNELEEEQDLNNEMDASAVGVNKDKHVYSIDSPTYQATTDWNLDDYSNGVKCKQYFEPSTDTSSSGSRSMYSPMSTISYCSPRSSLNSSDYSPCSSPVSMCSSEINNDPNYPFICSIPYSSSSPEKEVIDSPHGYSPSSSISNFFDSKFQNSEEKGYQPDKEKTSACNFTVKTDADFCKDGASSSESSDTEDTYSLPDVEDSYRDQKLKEKKTSEREQFAYSCPEERDISKKKKLRHSSSNEDESSEILHPSKRQRVKKSPRTQTATENHILMILSRISQKLDTSKYLVTKETVCCLLDYIATVDQAESRAVRILSRLVRNPQCFEKFLQLNFPWIVYTKLLAVGENDESWTCFLKNGSFSFQDSTKMKRQSSVYSCHSDEGLVIDVESSFSGSFDNSEREAHEELEDMSTEEKLSVDVIAGMTLLQDLCLMADAPFGRGIIGHLLATEDEHKQMCCAICLLYICWNKSMRKHYFFKMKVLDKIFDELREGPKKSRYFNYLLEGLAVLGKITNFSLRLNNSDLRSCFRTIFSDDETYNYPKTCKCKEIIDDDLVLFVLKQGGESVRASRQILSSSSPLFTAMLQGHYVESKQKEIVLKDTSLYAVRYISHYLHGCGTTCDVIDDLLTCDVTSQMLSRCLDVLSLANKYLVSSLQEYLMTTLCTRFLHPEFACLVYSFAELHDFQDLLQDCVRATLVNGTCVRQRVQGMQDFLLGPNSQSFIEDLKQLLKS